MAFRRNVNDSDVLIAVSFIPRATHAVGFLQTNFFNTELQIPECPPRH